MQVTEDFFWFCFPVVEEMDSDDEEESVPMVTIGIRKVPYQEVTPDMVEQMTPAEKDEYIRIGQELYSDMYEWWIKWMFL